MNYSLPFKFRESISSEFISEKGNLFEDSWCGCDIVANGEKW